MLLIPLRFRTETAGGLTDSRSGGSGSAQLGRRSLVLCEWPTGTSSQDVSVERQHAGLGGNSDQQELAGERALRPSVGAEGSPRTWTGETKRNRVSVEAVV